MRIGQTTLGSNANTPLLPVGTPNTYASSFIIQNNAGHDIRVGDNTTSTTKGLLINASGSNTLVVNPPHGTLLNSWYIAGTNTDVIDWLYEAAQ